MPFLDRFHAVSPADPSHYVRFEIDGHLLGLTAPAFAQSLIDTGDVFVMTGNRLSVNQGLNGFEERSDAVAAILARLRDRGVIPDWRGELYPVKSSWDAEPLLTIERAAAGLFGVRAFGVHLNGLVRTDQGLSMWIGTRALDKAVAPGKLDQLVAGGQPHGLSITENLIKECGEEADMSEVLARQAQPVGAITYRTAKQPQGLRWDTLFCFDLLLDEDFTPRNTDGELQGFELLPIADVIALVRDTDDFKFNCSLVIIDFLIRWGYITPDTDDEYLDLIKALHG